MKKAKYKVEIEEDDNVIVEIEVFDHNKTDLICVVLDSFFTILKRHSKYSKTITRSNFKCYIIAILDLLEEAENKMENK